MRRLTQVRTLNDAAQLWIDACDELWDYTLVLSCDGVDGGFPWPARVDLEGKAFLRSVFSRSRLWFVNHDILREMAKEGGHVDVLSDYSISFDTNAVNYLRAMVEGRSPEIVEIFRRVARTLSGTGFNWDIMPYLKERAEDIQVAAPDALDSIWRAVHASEYFAACDKGEFARSGKLVLTLPESEVTAKTHHILSSLHQMGAKSATSRMDREFACFYVFMLEIAAIEQRIPGRSASGEKLLLLMEFFHTEVSAMHLNVLWAGGKLFQQGSHFRPLQKLLSAGPAVLRNAKNVAWDFYHLTMLRQYATNIGHEGSFLVPYLLTFDRGIAELMDGFANRSCLLEPDKDLPTFIPELDVEAWLHDGWINLRGHFHRYFSYEGMKERAAMREQKGLFDPFPIISRLETELLAH